MAAPAAAPKCRHCKRRKQRRPRGLCDKCHADRGVRYRYPAKARRPDVDEFEGREPTEAELDALVAEQSRPENLPGWWAEECVRVMRGEYGD